MNQTNDNDKGAMATRGHLITAGGCCRMGKVECDESRRVRETSEREGGCLVGNYCLLTDTYLELSTVCNAFDVLLFNDGCSK